MVPMDPQDLLDRAPVLFCEVLEGRGPLWTIFDIANALIGEIEESDVCRHGVSFRCGAAKECCARLGWAPSRAALATISALLYEFFNAICAQTSRGRRRSSTPTCSLTHSHCVRALMAASTGAL